MTRRIDIAQLLLLTTYWQDFLVRAEDTLLLLRPTQSQILHRQLSSRHGTVLGIPGGLLVFLVLLAFLISLEIGATLYSDKLVAVPNEQVNQSSSHHHDGLTVATSVDNEDEDDANPTTTTTNTTTTPPGGPLVIVIPLSSPPDEAV